MVVLQWLKKKLVALGKWFITPNPPGHLAAVFFILAVWAIYLAVTAGYINVRYTHDMTLIEYYLGWTLLISLLLGVCFFFSFGMTCLVVMFVDLGATHVYGEFIVIEKDKRWKGMNLLFRTLPKQTELFEETNYQLTFLTYRNMVVWLIAGIFIGWWRYLGQKLKLHSLSRSASTKR